MASATMIDTVINAKPPVTAEHRAEIERHKAKKAAALKARQESWERSDTDGFLSQWASGITANEEQLAVEIAENGGAALFPALVRASDLKRIRAKLIETRYGTRWAVCDEQGQFTGVFLPHGDNSRKLRKLGLVIAMEWAPAKATIKGSGTGLSGTAWAAVVRTDCGYPKDAIRFGVAVEDER